MTIFSPPSKKNLYYKKVMKAQARSMLLNSHINPLYKAFNTEMTTAYLCVKNACPHCKQLIKKEALIREYLEAQDVFVQKLYCDDKASAEFVKFCKCNAVPVILVFDKGSVNIYNDSDIFTFRGGGKRLRMTDAER